jgi:uncharacterized protein YdhG (YjbR/CyaY superfamily)
MKTMKKPATVDDYIKSCPAAVGKKLEQLRAAILSSAPGATEKISYGMPAYFLNGRLVYFAAQKAHVGFYALPGAIKAFAKDCAAYKTSTGTVQFPLDRPIPVGLVKKMVAFRVSENRARKKSKRVRA